MNSTLEATAQQAEQGQAPEKSRPQKKSQQRFSRLTTLSLVLLGVVAVAAIAYFAFGVQLLNGQVGVLATLGAITVFFVGQFIRFRERISLRTLLLIVTVLAVGLAYIGRNLADSRNETIVVDQLVESGAKATYGEGRKFGQSKEEYFRTEGGWYLPTWVSDWMGAGYFSSLTDLDLSDAGMQDQHLQMLADIRSLESLTLRNEKLTAEGVAKMPLIPGLNSLQITWDQVSPESMARVKEMRALKQLYVIPHYDVYAAPLVTNAPRQPVSDLAALQQVESLYVTLAAADPAGMTALANMKSLNVLYLFAYPTGAKLDVSGFGELGKSQTIRSLTIGLGEFGDAELDQLKSISSLNVLQLSNTGVTANGVRAFQAERPNVTLIINPPIPGVNGN